MAPVAATFIMEHGGHGRNAIVADTGGTTYDVALVRDGVIPETRETWIGQPYLGHMTGFPVGRYLQCWGWWWEHYWG
uniref:Hydantoinase A/oxoprolinase domain-containing protein n=1 Tax=uncultured alpha proteobacterium EF100_94H03 TaxID=710800 RepID=E0Y221_9PROT|nr:hypothetical protein [uncultured alpha proteobacterium EF100_94H03]